MILQRWPAVTLALLTLLILAGAGRAEVASPVLCAHPTKSTDVPPQTKKEEDKEDDRKVAELVEKLLAKIRDKKMLENNKIEVEEAIILLGMLEARQAIPDLVELLEFRTTMRTRFAATTELYPAAKVLHDIGKPAIPFIVRALAEKDRSHQFIKNATITMRFILRTRKEVKEVLNKEIKSEKDEKKAQRLKNVEKAIEPEDGPVKPPTKETK